MYLNNQKNITKQYSKDSLSDKHLKINNNSKSSLLDSLIEDFYFTSIDVIPKDVFKRISSDIRNVFQYYINNNIEEVLLLLNKKNNYLKVVLKVCPAYLEDNHNLGKIEEYLNESLIVFSLKDFYINNLKKYYH